jgi:hypothetical protein
MIAKDLAPGMEIKASAIMICSRSAVPVRLQRWMRLPARLAGGTFAGTLPRSVK